MEKTIEFLFSHGSEIFSSLTTLSAAFFGAWFAFRFQNSHEKKKALSDSASAINIVHLQLFQHYNNLLQLRKDFKSKFPDDPIYWLNIPPFSKRDFFPEVNISGLGFFVQTGNPTLVAKILLAQEKYNEIIKILNARSELHLGQLQPILENIVSGKGEISDPSDFLSKIGERLSGGLRNYTDGIFATLPEVITFFENLSKEIFEESKKQVPKHKFLRFVPSEVNQSVSQLNSKK